MAGKSSERCVVCRQKISGLDDFATFQRVVRGERSRATRICYSEPILSTYPKALVGNYGVYPNDGRRYWYDYFETFFDRHPHVIDQSVDHKPIAATNFRP